MNINEALNKETLERLYVAEGKGSVEIAKRIGASPAGVTQALKRFGIPVRSRSESARIRHCHTWSADWPRLSGKYDRGATLEEIAREVGCSLDTASRHLSEHITLRPRGCEVKPNSRGKIEIDVGRAISMNEGGATLTEIADEMSVSVQIVSKRLREAGHKVITWKASREKFANVQAKKRKVAEAIDAKSCAVCGEKRGVQLCHIQPRRKGGPLNPDNAVALCPNHHWYFDRGVLDREEIARLDPILVRAADKGYEHHRYGTDDLGTFLRVLEEAV